MSGKSQTRESLLDLRAATGLTEVARFAGSQRKQRHDDKNPGHCRERDEIEPADVEIRWKYLQRRRLGRRGYLPAVAWREPRVLEVSGLRGDHDSRM
jgi:hypothetical protein